MDLFPEFQDFEAESPNGLVELMLQYVDMDEMSSVKVLFRNDLLNAMLILTLVFASAVSFTDHTQSLELVPAFESLLVFKRLFQQQSQVHLIHFGVYLIQPAQIEFRHMADYVHASEWLMEHGESEVGVV